MISKYDQELILDWFHNQIGIREISKKINIARNRIEIFLKDYDKYEKGKLCLECLTVKHINDFNGTKIRKCKYCQKIYHQILNSNKTSKEIRKTYRKNNKDKTNSFIKSKSKTDINFKLRKRISCSIARYLKENRSGKAIENLEYSVDELKYHIENLFEPWMNWQNHGIYSKKWNDEDPLTWTWQIDHIIAHSSFKYKNTLCNEFKKCWALSNLRPLSSKQNCFDGVRK